MWATGKFAVPPHLRRRDAGLVDLQELRSVFDRGTDVRLLSWWRLSVRAMSRDYLSPSSLWG